MSDPVALADRFVELLRERAASQDAEPVHKMFIEHYQVLEGVLRSDPAGRDAILARLTSYLTPDAPGWDFACIANVCGVAVEMGAEPTTAGVPILDRLPSLLAGAKELADALHKRFGHPNLEAIPEEQWDAAARQSPEAGEEVRRFLSIAFAGRAAMTMLARSKPLRDLGRPRDDLAQAVMAARDVNPYAFFLAELLGSADGEEVVVLDPARQAGFRVRLHCVRNNFHFFTLLQHTLLSHPKYAGWAGEKPATVLEAVAKGERMMGDVTQEEWAASGTVDEKGEVYDRGVFQFYQWPAVQPDGHIETAKEAEPNQPWWAWGEMHPGQLSDLDGVRLLILGEPEMPRAWGVGFFAPIHPALRSAVTIERELSAESVKGWLDEIKAVPRQPIAAAAQAE